MFYLAIKLKVFFSLAFLKSVSFDLTFRAPTLQSNLSRTSSLRPLLRMLAWQNNFDGSRPLVKAKEDAGCESAEQHFNKKVKKTG